MTDDQAPPMLPYAALEKTAALVLIVDRDGHIVAANDAALAALRLSRKDAVGAEATPLLTTPKEQVGFIQALRVVARTGLSRSHVHEMSRSSAGQRSLAWSTSLIGSEPPLLACIGVDVSAAKSEADDLLTKSQTDELTGLSNRAHLIATLGHMQGSGAAVLFCDLNGFKAVNDAHGHAAGDAVLVEVARRLRRVVRAEDFVARLGGDEFIVIAPPHATGSAESLARRILATMRQPMLLSGGLVVVVGVSIGTAELAPGEDPVAVLKKADAHMYEVKSLRGSRSLAPSDVDLVQQRMATSS